MKKFWSKYKTGLLIVLLPLMVVFVLSRIMALIWGAADFLYNWIGGPPWIQGVIFAALLAAPFLIGWAAAHKKFASALRRTFSFFGAGWLAKSILKDDYLEKIKSGEYQVVIFEICASAQSFKIGLAVNTFRWLDSDYCLILEMTPPLPTGPFWIKRRSMITFLSPEFALKHLLMTTFSFGLNFPLEEKDKNQNPR